MSFPPNPLLWQREHQIALAIAAALGFAVAYVLSFWLIEDGRHWTIEYTKFNGALGWLPIYRRLVLPPLWGGFGALIGVALVYIRQLLRT